MYVFISHTHNLTHVYEKCVDLALAALIWFHSVDRAQNIVQTVLPPLACNKHFTPQRARFLNHTTMKAKIMK